MFREGFSDWNSSFQHDLGSLIHKKQQQQQQQQKKNNALTFLAISLNNITEPLTGKMRRGTTDLTAPAIRSVHIFVFYFSYLPGDVQE